MRKHKTETFENTNICSACKTESSFRMIAACTLTQTTVQKPRAELQRQELQHHISLHYLCLLKNSLQKLYYHFSGEKKKKNSASKSRGQKELQENSDLFQSLIFSPTCRKHGYNYSQESKPIPTVTEPNKQLLKGTNKVSLGKVSYVLHTLGLQQEPTKAPM